jgi:hypothetical protein
MGGVRPCSLLYCFCIESPTVAATMYHGMLHKMGGGYRSLQGVFLSLRHELAPPVVV